MDAGDTVNAIERLAERPPASPSDLELGLNTTDGTDGPHGGPKEPHCASQEDKKSGKLFLSV